MPRKGRGGKRSGTPGKLYSNRSDLNQASNRSTQPVMTAPSEGREFGAVAADASAQRALPLPQRGGGGAPPTASPPVVGGTPAVIPLSAPTTRPDEPITAGLGLGDGPGPDALMLGSTNLTGRSVLERAVAANPNPWLQSLIEASSP